MKQCSSFTPFSVIRLCKVPVINPHSPRWHPQTRGSALTDLPEVKFCSLAYKWPITSFFIKRTDWAMTRNGMRGEEGWHAASSDRSESISQKQSEGAAQHHAHCATFGSDASVNQKPPLKYSFNSVCQLSACVGGGVNTHVQLIGMERQMLCGSAWIWQPFAAPNPPCHHA